MATFKVTAPAGDYQGKVGAVQFREGRAEIDDARNPAELAYCRNAGYLVEPLDGDEGEGTGENGGSEPASAQPGVFDPAEHNAEDVLSYLDQADHDEAVRVLDAEAAGNSRKGITGKRDAILASKKKEGEDQ